MERGILGSTRIGWARVRRVDAGPDVILSGTRRRSGPVETSGFSPEQRATLERTIARQIREAQAPAARP